MQTSVTEIIENLKNQYSLDLRIQFLFGECSIEMVTNSRELLDDLQHYYKDFVVNSNPAHITVTAIEAPVPDMDYSYTVKHPDPGKSKIKEEYADFMDGRIVRKRLTGMHFIFGGGQHFAVGPAVKNSNQVINFINNRYIQWLVDRGYLLAHAAGIEWKGQGAAFAGFSGMGKSTLALHLMSRGANFISNDRLLVKKNDQSIEMLGIPKLPRINPGTALNNEDLEKVIPASEKENFKDLSGEELWNLEHKYDVFIDQCFGTERFVLSADMNLLVILNWKPNGQPPCFNLVDLNVRRDLLQAFMKSLGLFYDSKKDVAEPDFPEESYLRQLQGCRVLEISGGVDFQKAADVCIKFIENLSFSEEKASQTLKN